MSVPVYQLLTRDTYGNAYTINRHESWCVVKDTTFPDQQSAQQYVSEKMQQNPDFIRLTADLSPQERVAFLHSFCTNPMYTKYHRHFVGLPDWKQLAASLEQDGIVVQHPKILQ